MDLNLREQRALKFIRHTGIELDQVRSMLEDGGGTLGLKNGDECNHLAAHLSNLPHDEINIKKATEEEPVWSFAQGTAEKYN